MTLDKDFKNVKTESISTLDKFSVQGQFEARINYIYYKVEYKFQLD